MMDVRVPWCWLMVGLAAVVWVGMGEADAAWWAIPPWLPLSCMGMARLMAGAAKVDVTDRDAGPAANPLYVKALILKHDQTVAIIATVDAVAIEEIGGIANDYLATVRAQVARELPIDPAHLMVNASHCHGIVRKDVAQLTVAAIKQAWENLVPVRVGSGVGHEDRIMENRRLKLEGGGEGDMRHAYPLPPDEQVVGVGPVDPQIGVLRLDREDGRTLAVIYNFAVHPIQGVPSKANTSDITGFASQVIEDNLDEGTVALFLQGCGGDINPIGYKDVNIPRDAEPLGNLLGLSTLKAVRKITCQTTDVLRVMNETLELPRSDHAPRIVEMEAEQLRLLDSLGGVSLSFNTFVPLLVKYSLSPKHPSYSSHRYFSDEAAGRDGLTKLDEENRRSMEQYIRNIHIMEQLLQIRVNLDLLKKHHARNLAADTDMIPAEVFSFRVGDFVLVTFPGELSVQTGLNIKAASPHPHTFIAGVTNGYLYYTPTAEQISHHRSVGAQEDSECLVSPRWQNIFETRASDVLGRL